MENQHAACANLFTWRTILDLPGHDAWLKATSSSEHSTPESGETPHAPTCPVVAAPPQEAVRYVLASTPMCDHRSHWRHVRAKRNHSYYTCKLCGLHWRQARPDPTRRAKKHGTGVSQSEMNNSKQTP